MKLLQQFQMLKSSPGYLRDRRFLLSAGALGLAAIILNGALLAMLLGLLGMPSEVEYFLGGARQLGEIFSLLILTGIFLVISVVTPLRLTDIFLGPRLAGYFDQVVLSGISPLRFVAGRLWSQNLVYLVVISLLIPWIVMTVFLGGTAWPIFLVNLLLLYVYSLMLAAVTLWLSLYFNELLTLLVVISGVGVLSLLAIAPIPYQVFVVTPVPAIVYQTATESLAMEAESLRSFASVYWSCLGGMGLVTVGAIAGIWLGPLTVVHRETSTFGEVVYPGDSTKKRWLRIRLHARRLGELTFFYQNRCAVRAPWELLFRWGGPLAVILCGSVIGLSGILADYLVTETRLQRMYADGGRHFAANLGYRDAGGFLLDYLIGIQITVGLSTLVAAVAFSRSRAAAGVRVPIGRRRALPPLVLDSFCFLLILCSIGAGSFGLVDRISAGWLQISGRATVMPAEAGPMQGLNPEPVSSMQRVGYFTRYQGLEFRDMAVRALALHLMSAFALWACLQGAGYFFWSRSLTAMMVVPAYAFLVWLLPLFLVMVFRDAYFPLLERFSWFAGLISPLTGFLILHRELVSEYGTGNAMLPFWFFHTGICLLALFLLRHRLRWLQVNSILKPVSEATGLPPLEAAATMAQEQVK